MMVPIRPLMPIYAADLKRRRQAEAEVLRRAQVETEVDREILIDVEAGKEAESKEETLAQRDTETARRAQSVALNTIV
jgi:hypothetical protein